MIDLQPNKGIIYVKADCPGVLTTIDGVWFVSDMQDEWSYHRNEKDEVEQDIEDGEWVTDAMLSDYMVKSDGSNWKLEKDSLASPKYSTSSFGYTTYYLVDKDKMRTVYEEYVSPYHIAGVLEEKMYLLSNEIPAIKKDGKFFNLISLKYFDYTEYKPDDWRFGYEYELLGLDFIIKEAGSPLCSDSAWKGWEQQNRGG